MYDMDKLQLLNLANQYGQNRNCTSSSNQFIDMKYKFGGLAGKYLNVECFLALRDSAEV